jgi:predicted transcriptional regulator
VEAGNGTLQDVIDARAFWDTEIIPPATNPTISQIVEELDKSKKYQKFHGASFFVKVSSDDKVSEVLERMGEAKVGIVVDDNGRPFHYFTKGELQSVLNVQKRFLP